MNNELPMNVILENARTKINKAVSECIMEYGIPAFLMTGILSEALLEAKRQEKIELNNSYSEVVEALKEEIKILENKDVK